MTILNITPDSFYDGGKNSSDKALLNSCESAIINGSSILDIGGMSTRPGADEIPEQEELDRIVPAFKAISSEFPETILSIDTYRANVAKAALESGANIVNDISGGQYEPEIWKVCAEHGAPYILMHSKGKSKTMQDNPQYENVVLEVFDYFIDRIKRCKEAGIKDIVLDLGFGFGKNIEHNYTLLREMANFKSIGLPILTGISRKGMIYRPLGAQASDALNGTTALHMASLERGSKILRVHDTKEAMETIKLFELLNKS